MYTCIFISKSLNKVLSMQCTKWNKLCIEIYLMRFQRERSRVNSRRMRVFEPSVMSRTANWNSRPLSSHQYTFVEPKKMSCGRSSPLRVGCQSLAMSGKSDAKLLVTLALRLAQQGHPLSPLVRLLNCASHSWSGPAGHLNQNFFFEPMRIWNSW